MYRMCILALAGAVLSASAVAETRVFHTPMSGASEVPPTTSADSGSVNATLDTATKTLTYAVFYENLTGPATAAYFHGPAAIGANAGVAMPIAGGDIASPIRGTATLTDAQMEELLAGKWYVNVHTKANPAGEIRASYCPANSGQPARRFAMGSKLAETDEVAAVTLILP
jgi:hypothetical protein